MARNMAIPALCSGRQVVLIRRRSPAGDSRGAAPSVADDAGASNPAPGSPRQVGVGRLADQAPVHQGGAQGEVVKVLEAGGLEPQGLVHGVVEVAADPGPLNAGGLGLQVERLAQDTRLPEASAIQPGPVGDVVKAGQHGEREGPIGGDVLVARNLLGEVAQVQGCQQVQGQMVRATGDARPEPVRAQLGLQDGQLGRVPHQGVDPRGEPLHPVHEQDRMHLGRCGEQRPGRLTNPRQQGVEQTEEGRGPEPGDAVEGLGGAAAPDQTGGGFRGHRLPWRQGPRGPGRQWLVGGTQGRGGHPGDVRPVPVSRAQGIGLAAPGRACQSIQHRLHGRWLTRSDPQQGLRNLPFRRQEVRFPISPCQGGDLGIAPGRRAAVSASRGRRPRRPGPPGRGRSRAGSSGRRACRTSRPRASGCRSGPPAPRRTRTTAPRRVAPGNAVRVDSDRRPPPARARRD